MSDSAEKDYSSNPEHIRGTGTPAEDREEERAKNRLWDLKEEAKWGRDIETQKRAIQDLRRNGNAAMSYLEEILSVVPPGEIRQYCQDAIDSIISPQRNEAKKNPVEKNVEKASLETKVSS